LISIVEGGDGLSDQDPFPAHQNSRDQIVALVPRLRRFCQVLTKSIDAGDDLAQATIERALSRMDQWQQGTRLDNWMFKIARNIFIDSIRTSKRRGTHVDLGELADLSGEDGRQITETRSDLARAQQAIASLTDEQRALVALVIVDGRSYKEAASILDIPIGTVMSRIARARQSIDVLVNHLPSEPLVQ
jgi:RNA polymerase sigma-70 factor, ECF subfamily